MLNKLKGWFTEEVTAEHGVSPRAARLTGVKVPDLDEVRLKKWVKSTLSMTPWAAVAILLFAVFLQGAVATGALVYGLVKAAIAVLVAVIADETMFNGLREPKEQAWLPMIRRSMVFIGVCWLMSVT